MIVNARHDTPIYIGRLGENEVRIVRFSVANVLAEFPDAAITLLHQRPGDADAYPVPAEWYTVDGGNLLWTVQSGDLARTGFGKCELIATIGVKVAKSVIYMTEIGPALDGSEEPPDPWQGWVHEVTEAAERAEAAAWLLEHPGAEAVTLEAGSDATAAYADGTFTFGIPTGTRGEPGPRGETGPQGETGPRGEPGDDAMMIADQIEGNRYRIFIGKESE